jgi:ActR/RegA family two-component response regulator
MKLLIFENEYHSLKDSFNAVNLLYFQNNLNIEVKAKSQDFDDFNKIFNYDYIMVDIELAEGSELDGYGILKKIFTIKGNQIKPKVIILTGHSKVKESLVEQNINTNIPIILKPVSFNGIYNALNN